MMMTKTLKLAVLIDADNSSYKQIPLILQEVAKYGIASVKRIYGDWSSDQLGAWREILLPHAITPIQQFAYTKGKDATDMMLIINAMDLLYSNALDGFCIVSSDSDFTPLASRIRESGLVVYGFGKQTTPTAFINACDKFIYTENLEAIIQKDEISKINKVVTNEKLEIDKPTLNLIYKAIKDTGDENGWANLADLGKYLVSVKPDFDTRTYGRAKLSGLLDQLNLFEIKIQGTQKFVRKKPCFSEFLKLVQEVIQKYFTNEDWIEVSILVGQIAETYPELDMLQYNCKNIHQAILMIESKYFEFDKKKTKIKYLPSNPIL